MLGQRAVLSINTKLGILPIVFLLLLGCRQQDSNKVKTTNSKTQIGQSEQADDYYMDWVDAVNGNDVTRLEKMYASNAIAIFSMDSIIDTASQIARFYGAQEHKITAIASVFNIEADKDRQIDYELIRYMTEAAEEYVQLVIWRQEAKKPIRVFEFTETSSLEAEMVDTNQIAQSRKSWIELCNVHNAENLVDQLYGANTIYFNHKPIVKGTKDLIAEYAYMNNPDYTLDLRPIKLEVVNANLAIEIGQCSGSYAGKYILVWKKQADGNWKIHIDSNI